MSKIHFDGGSWLILPRPPNTRNILHLRALQSCYLSSNSSQIPSFISNPSESPVEGVDMGRRLQRDIIIDSSNYILVMQRGVLNLLNIILSIISKFETIWIRSQTYDGNVVRHTGNTSKYRTKIILITASHLTIRLLILGLVSSFISFWHLFSFIHCTYQCQIMTVTQEKSLSIHNTMQVIFEFYVHSKI